jgi:DnaJ-class molecular chaperone
VAGKGDAKQDLSEATHEPRECMACRGTGRVISNLGGSPSTVACPWCEGSGMRPAEIDAQAHWAPEGAEVPQAAEVDSGEDAEDDSES